MFSFLQDTKLISASSQNMTYPGAFMFLSFVFRSLFVAVFRTERSERNVQRKRQPQIDYETQRTKRRKTFVRRVNMTHAEKQPQRRQ